MKTLQPDFYIGECSSICSQKMTMPLRLTDQKYTEPQSGPILLHSFLEVHNCVASFITTASKLHKFGAEKPIS
jgi:hypothetical protein